MSTVATEPSPGQPITSPVSSERVTLSQIDESMRGPAILFISTACAWLLIGTVLAIITSIKGTHTHVPRRHRVVDFRPSPRGSPERDGFRLVQQCGFCGCSLVDGSSEQDTDATRWTFVCSWSLLECWGDRGCRGHFSGSIYKCRVA